jgi:hypothetical protein
MSLSTAMAISTAENRKILTNKADWEEWFEQISRHARRDDIWDYCNPDLLDTTLGTRTTGRPDTEPAVQRPHLNNEEPVRPRHLSTSATPEQQKAYQYQRDDYKEDRLRYEKIQRSLASLDTYIESTLDRQNHPIIRNQTGPYEKLKALQKELKPTTVYLRAIARQQYEAAQLGCTKKKAEEWNRAFRNAFLEAQRQNLPSVQDGAAQNDFISAISSTNEGCATYLRGLLSKAEISDDPIPSMKDFFSTFDHWMRMEPIINKKAPSSHSAFATFQGKEMNHPNTSRGGYRGQGRGGSSQGRSGSDTHLCAFCDRNHKDEDCWQADHRNAPPDWDPDRPSRAKRTYDERMEKSPELQRKRQKLLQRPESELRRPSQVDTPTTFNNPKTESKGKRLMAGATIFSGATAFAGSSTGLITEDYDNSEHINHLIHCWILDPGADIHICNNMADFVHERNALPGDKVMAGGAWLPIQAWGRSTITVEGPNNNFSLTLHDVALVPEFFTSLVSLSMGEDIHFDSGRSILYRGSFPGRTLCRTIRRGGHWCLMIRDTDPTAHSKSALIAAARSVTQDKPQPSKQRKSITKSATDLHYLMACAGPETIAHLASSTTGIEMVEGRAPQTHECDACGTSKATQVISRRSDHEQPATRSFEKVAFDIIELYEPTIDQTVYIYHFLCTFSKFNIVLLSKDKKKTSIILAIKKVHKLAAVQFRVLITIL